MMLPRKMFTHRIKTGGELKSDPAWAIDNFVKSGFFSSKVGGGAMLWCRPHFIDHEDCASAIERLIKHNVKLAWCVPVWEAGTTFTDMTRKAYYGSLRETAGKVRSMLVQWGFIDLTIIADLEAYHSAVMKRAMEHPNAQEYSMIMDAINYALRGFFDGCLPCGTSSPKIENSQIYSTVAQLISKPGGLITQPFSPGSGSIKYRYDYQTVRFGGVNDYVAGPGMEIPDKTLVWQEDWGATSQAFKKAAG